MGQGIVGAISTSFRFKKGWCEPDDADRKKDFTKRAGKDFFDFYNENQVDNENGGKETYYTVKSEILLPNFKDFFIEFQNLIGNADEIGVRNGLEKFNEDYDKIVASGNIDDFLKYFDDHRDPPVLFEYFSTAYINTNRQDLLVYQGSYKAFLEEWSTLGHMEYLLRAAMKNPLAKIMKFGLSL